MSTVELSIANANLKAEIGNTACTVLEGGNLNCKALQDPIEIKINGEKPIGGRIVFNNGKILTSQTWIKMPNGFVYGYMNNSLVKIEKEREQSYIMSLLPAGLYTEDYELTKTWDELIENNYLTVTNGELTSGYVNANNHPSTDYIEGTLVVSEGVTKIGNTGLRALSKMTEVYFPSTLQSIGASGTGGSALAECTNLRNIIVNDNNENYTSENGVLFNKNMTKLILYPNMN